jgi:hypothetical protein
MGIGSMPSTTGIRVSSRISASSDSRGSGLSFAKSSQPVICPTPSAPSKKMRTRQTGGMSREHPDRGRSSAALPRGRPGQLPQWRAPPQRPPPGGLRFTAGTGSESQPDLQPHFLLHRQQRLRIAFGVVHRVVGVAGAAQVFKVLEGVVHEALVEAPKVG